MRPQLKKLKKWLRNTTVLKNRFINPNRALAGHRSKGYGQLFENMIKMSCIKTSIFAVKMPDGCRTIMTKFGVPALRRVHTPFDFMLIAEGMTCFIDAKTIESGNFSYSMLEQHQVHALLKIHDHNVSAGYLVWYRKKNEVIFYRASLLYHLKPNDSLNPESGINVGVGENFNLNLILGTAKGA